MSESDITCPECGAEILDVDVKCSECGVSLASTGAQRIVGSVVLEQYLVEEVLGQGGMSVVYRGRHKITDQEVALKILPPELAAHSQVKSRFLEEARALAQLDHPNIVHLYNFGQENGSFVLAMQFVHGRTWERLILEEDEALDWERSTRIAIDVCNALDYAHERGIIHRDMKPSNVLLRDENGSACVMDFGIAKMESSTRLTATGQTMGTVRYMSPEQVRGRAVDLRTDIYSLCITLYESLAGDTPFDGETHFEIMTKHLSEPPPSLTRRGVKVPRALEAAVMKGMAKRIEDRPSSAAKLREMLSACLSRDAPVPDLALAGTAESTPLPEAAVTSDEPVSGAAAEPVAPGAGRRPRLWIALAGVLVLASAAVVFALSRSPLGGGSEQAGQRRSAKTIEPPADAHSGPFLLRDLHFATDKTFEEDKLRVLSVAARDPGEVRDSYDLAIKKFLDYLAGQGLGEGVVVKPLTVVIVPGHVLCDRRLYDSHESVPASCGEPDFHWYRPRESTLYLPDTDQGLTIAMTEGVGFHVCLHSPRIQEDCDAAFARYNPRDQK